MGPNTSKLYENHQKTPETCLFSPKNDENLTKNGVGRHDFWAFLSVYKVFVYTQHFGPKVNFIE